MMAKAPTITIDAGTPKSVGCSQLENVFRTHPVRAKS